MLGFAVTHPTPTVESSADPRVLNGRATAPGAQVLGWTVVAP
jgi:hypothetical protein